MNCFSITMTLIRTLQKLRSLALRGYRLVSKHLSAHIGYIHRCSLFTMIYDTLTDVQSVTYLI